MVEWKLIEKLAKIPELIGEFSRIISHPLIRKYSHINHGENQNLI